MAAILIRAQLLNALKHFYSSGIARMRVNPTILSTLITLSLLVTSSVSMAADEDVLLLELTLAQQIINNSLSTIQSQFAADRQNTTVRLFDQQAGDVSPIESIVYGYIPDTISSCSLDLAAASGAEFTPCLALSYVGSYAVEVRFKSVYTSGTSLSSYTKNKKILFIARNIDNGIVDNNFTGPSNTINSGISYFSCYNPSFVDNLTDDGTGIDNVNNGSRLGGNPLQQGNVTAISTPDGQYGGLNSCLSSANI